MNTFGEDPSQDSPQGIIECTQPSTFYEIRMSQWRGAVWRDPSTGVHWLCAAGLAKGNHKDSDDFYKRPRSTMPEVSQPSIRPRKISPCSSKKPSPGCSWLGV